MTMRGFHYIMVAMAMIAVAMATEAPEDVVSEMVFETVGEHPYAFINELIKAVPQHQVQLYDILQRVLASRDTSAKCRGCQMGVSVITYLVKVGYVYEDMDDAIITFCKLLFFMQNTPWRKPGDKVCNTTISNYGPHVENILRYNRMLPEETCWFINACSDDEASFEMPPVGEIINLLPFNFTRPTLPSFPSLPTLPSLPSLPTRPPKVHYSDWKLPAGEVLRSQLTKQHLPHRFNRHTRRQRDWQGDDNILRVAQFTDIHIDELYEEGAPTKCGLPVCCRDLGGSWQPNEGSARPYGEYNCNVPPATTRLFLSKTKELNPEIVLYSGDSPPHHLWEETLAWQMNVTIKVAAEFENYFPDVPVYSAIGNHECFPSNMYHPKHKDTKQLHETFISSFGPLAKFQADQEATVRQGGYFETLIRPGLRLLSLNTNFGYTGNWYNMLHYHGNEFEEMLSWAIEVFTEARSNNEKVVVISHHPCGDNVRYFDELMTDVYVQFSDIIVLNVVGHEHIDEFRIFSDTSGTPKGVQFLSQSANSYSKINPGVRMYYFDNTTLQLLGYEQYYLNISDQTDPVGVDMLYDTLTAYDLHVLNAASMMDFAGRMNEDDSLFQKFCANRVTGAPSSGCDKTSTLCRQVTSTRTDREKCVADNGALLDTLRSASRIIYPSLSTLLLLLLLLLAL